MATTSGSASPHAPDMPEWAGQIKPPAPINPAQLSFAERKARLARASTPHLVEGDQRMLRDIDWPPAGRPEAEAEEDAVGAGALEAAESVFRGRLLGTGVREHSQGAHPQRGTRHGRSKDEHDREAPLLPPACAPAFPNRSARS